MDHPLRLLCSYHYYKDVDLDASWKRYFGGLKVETFADSGAYSAMTQGERVDPAAYIAWANRWKHRFCAIAGPDVIGDAATTYRLTLRMRREVRGVPVLPVFHVGEPWEYLERWKGVEYLALGGMVPYTKEPDFLMRWIRQCFRRIDPATKVHGFGMTGWNVLTSFPWYSVDSTSWVAFARYAQLILFDQTLDKPVTLNLRDGRELLKSARLLRSYQLRPQDVRADIINSGIGARAKIVGALVESWWRMSQALRPAKRVHLVLGGRTSTNGESHISRGLRIHLAAVTRDLHDIHQSRSTR